MRRLWATFATTIFILCVALAGGQGDAILKQLNALRPPAWDQAKSANEQYSKEYAKQYAQYEQERGALIWKLFVADPYNKQIPDLMWGRWASFPRKDDTSASFDPYAHAVLADIKKTLALHSSAAIVEAAEAMKVYLMIYSSDGLHGKALASIQAFLKKYPTSKRANMLMLTFGDSTATEEEKTVIYRKFVEQFPKDPTAAIMRNAILRNENIGRPISFSHADLSGKTWDLAEHRGNVVVIDFWATWCPPCREMTPELKSIYAKYHSRGVEIVGLSMDQPEAQGGLTALKKYVKEHGMAWPQCYEPAGWDSKVVVGYGITSIPCTFLIDKKGNLRFVGHDGLTGRIEKLLKE